ncbi:MAG: hypothetical protein ACP5H5_01700 [Pyrobaculum sp.]
MAPAKLWIDAERYKRDRLREAPNGAEVLGGAGYTSKLYLT